jgi:hypothetical protein
VSTNETPARGTATTCADAGADAGSPEMTAVAASTATVSAAPAAPLIERIVIA